MQAYKTSSAQCVSLVKEGLTLSGDASKFLKGGLKIPWHLVGA